MENQCAPNKVMVETAEILRAVRTKYPDVILLLDELDFFVVFPDCVPP